VKDEWTGKLPDGRRVVYTYRHRRLGGAAATAEIERTDTLYLRENLPQGMSRGQVETLFRADLDGKP
jgi:hypothetical protein